MVRLYPEKADSSSIVIQTAEMGGQVDCRSTPVDSECQYSAGGGLQRGSQVIEVLGRRAFGRQDSVAVASPVYLAGRQPPLTPDDLRDHACIRVRLPSGKPYRWEFAKHGQEVSVDVPGTLTLDHVELMAEAAAGGLGIAYVPDRTARPHLDSGALVLVLDDWCPSIPGLFLYYSGHRHVPAGLRAFIDVLKHTG